MTSSAYRIRRDDQRFHESIESFIEEKAGADNEGRLCQVLQTYANGSDRRPDDYGQPDMWRGFPWLTMVFGSGALELPDAAGLAVGLAKAVEQHVAELVGKKGDDLATYLQAWHGRDSGADAPTRLAGEFTKDLAVGRLGGYGTAESAATKASGRGEGSAAAVPVDEFAAHLVLLAALLTRMYYTAQQRRVPPVARWDGDVAEADITGGTDETDLEASKLLIGRLRANTKRALGGKVNPSIRSAVGALLKGIEEDLGKRPARLRLGQLRLLTEVSWYCLSLGRPIYSGWTDLLLFLTLRQGGKGDVVGPAPLYRNLKGLPDMVAELYENPTRESWTQAGSQSDKQTARSVEIRDHLYREAANVLWAQGDAARAESDHVQVQGTWTPSARLLPPAVAFVTSFDIELDMAMWDSAKERNAQSGRAFRVILPLHLVQDTQDTFAELCWVMGEVDTNEWFDSSNRADPAEELKHLRSPINWRLVTNGTDEYLLREMPIIVHLNGCPLYPVPDLYSSEGARLREELVRARVAVGDEARLEHAVTIGEYLALRQSEAELIWQGFGASEQKDLDRNLPDHLLVNTERNPRYWLSMGVPVADAAVRHRLVSQLTRDRVRVQNSASSGGGGKRLGPKPKKSASDPGIGGAAINLRIGTDAAGLLYWAGLDLVQGDCNELTGELRHYAAHVRDPGSDQKQPAEGGICTLPDTEQ